MKMARRYIDPNSGAAPQPGGAHGDGSPAPRPMGGDRPKVKAKAPEPVPEPEPVAHEPEPKPEPEADAIGLSDEPVVETMAEPSTEIDADELEGMTRSALLELAGTVEVPGRHQMNKADLIEAIRAAG